MLACGKQCCRTAPATCCQVKSHQCVSPLPAEAPCRPPCTPQINYICDLDYWTIGELSLCLPACLPACPYIASSARNAALASPAAPGQCRCSLVAWSRMACLSELFGHPGAPLGAGLVHTRGLITAGGLIFCCLGNFGMSYAAGPYAEQVRTSCTACWLLHAGCWACPSPHRLGGVTRCLACSISAVCLSWQRAWACSSPHMMRHRSFAGLCVCFIAYGCCHLSPVQERAQVAARRNGLDIAPPPSAAKVSAYHEVPVSV
jgi:hypothetical protein